jgi:hypothetical protein
MIARLVTLRSEKAGGFYIANGNRKKMGKISLPNLPMAFSSFIDR